MSEITLTRETDISNALASTIEREVLVAADSGRKPKTVARLSDWEYLERSIHRLIAGWGRYFTEWNDKTAVHRHIWEQAECVRRLRERLTQFPGNVNNLDVPVSAQLEQLANTVLLAPSFEDAIDGIYQLLTGALTKSYLVYAQSAHPVHDAPTIATLHEILSIKESQRLWLREYRRRHPHQTDANYSAAIEAQLNNCQQLLVALPVDKDNPTQPAGLATEFRLPAIPSRPNTTKPRHEIIPLIDRDFTTEIEARRLFWCYGYMLEQNLADNQLRWIYDGHYMPWEFLENVSRHLWDESRHGDSGHSRLLDFGITIEEIGFPMPENKGELAEPMTPKDIYEAVFFIGMVAETGHFNVKNEGYNDFKAGGDLESAEMMIFDIIDEATHVQYAHRWLPVLAEKAGIDNTNYRERGVAERQKRQTDHDEKVLEAQNSPLDQTSADYIFYQELLTRMRALKPLSNATTCPPRSPRPM